MEILQCLNSIAIEAFKKGIKRNTGLFVELTKTNPHSLNVVYGEAYKFVNVEMELKLSKTLVSRPFDKLITSNNDSRERRPNSSHFKPKITPRVRLGTR